MPRFIDHCPETQPELFRRRRSFPEPARSGKYKGCRTWNGKRCAANKYYYCKKGVRSYVSADKSNGGVLDYFRRHHIGVKIFVQVFVPERIAHDLNSGIVVQSQEGLSQTHSSAIGWIHTRPDGTIGIRGIDTDLMGNQVGLNHHAHHTPDVEVRTHSDHKKASEPLTEGISRSIENDIHHTETTNEGEHHLGHGVTRALEHRTVHTTATRIEVEDEPIQIPTIVAAMPATIGATETVSKIGSSVQKINTSAQSQTQKIEDDEDIRVEGNARAQPTSTRTNSPEVGLSSPTISPKVVVAHRRNCLIHATIVRMIGGYKRGQENGRYDVGDMTASEYPHHHPNESNSHSPHSPAPHKLRRQVGYYGSSRIRQVQLRTAAAAAGISE